MYLYPRSSPEKEMEKLPVVQFFFYGKSISDRLIYLYLYHSYYGNSHVIKVIIFHLLNFLGIRYQPCATFFFISWKKVRAQYCNYGI